MLNNLLVVQGVVERRERLPILGNILIVLKDETISLSATDMEIELVARVGAPGGDGGEVTVPARKLLGYLPHPARGRNGRILHRGKSGDAAGRPEPIHPQYVARGRLSDDGSD